MKLKIGILIVFVIILSYNLLFGQKNYGNKVLPVGDIKQYACQLGLAGLKLLFLKYLQSWHGLCINLIETNTLSATNE